MTIRSQCSVLQPFRQALHAELNAHFRQTRKLHQSTLRLKCRALTLKKKLAHASAMLRPTLRQVTGRGILTRVLANTVWSADSWAEWCSELQADGCIAKAALPEVAHRKSEVACIAEAAAKAASKKVIKKQTAMKRTIFTRRRDDCLQRAGKRSDLQPLPTRSRLRSKTSRSDVQPLPIRRRLRSKTSAPVLQAAA